MVAIFLVAEAVKRLMQPEHINGDVMITVAVIGLVANLISAVLMHGGSKHNMNAKATYLHLLSDTLSSFGVIFGGLMIAWYISVESWPIVRHAVTILMQGAPKLDYEDIKTDLMKIDGITSVHHIHAWMIDENRIVFSAHVNMRDMKLSEAEMIYHRIERVLTTKYHIFHVTIQAEDVRGKDAELISLNEDTAEKP